MEFESTVQRDLSLPLLPLQELSLVKFVTMFCNNPEMLTLILRCHFHDTHTSLKLFSRRGEDWEAVKAKANELMSRVPNSFFKKMILGYLWPVSYRITLWKSVYAPFVDNSFLRHFYWTDRGRIDNTRTVSFLLENVNIPAEQRLILACSVCLVDEIFEIWEAMSREDKSHLYAYGNNRYYPIIRFWVWSWEELEFEFEFLDDAFVFATRNGLLENVKYLFDILPKEETDNRPILCSDGLIGKLRSGNLLEDDENHIQRFVFFELTDEEQKYTFTHFTESALTLLLHSSKYELCLQLLEERMGWTSVTDIVRSLKIIFYTYHLEVVEDDECRMLFMDVWRAIPESERDLGHRELGNVCIEILAALIRDNFPFLVEDDSFQTIACLKSKRDDNFHQGKWTLLIFIIEQGITITLLKKRRKKFLAFLHKIQSCDADFKNVLRFIRNIRSPNPVTIK